MIGDIPLIGMLKSSMRWHQERQRILAQNVANADTPGFVPKDLRALNFGANRSDGSPNVGLSATNAGHIIGDSSSHGSLVEAMSDDREATPGGNRVVLEDEVMKVSQNAMDYQLVSQLYGKGLGMIRTAMGRRA